MKNRYLIFLVPLIALLFSACGGSGDGQFDTGEEKINVPTCSDSNLTIAPNDLLVKDETNTTVTISHDANGTKTVCLSLGKAHIIREN